jgi:hypothetical protein
MSADPNVIYDAEDEARAAMLRSFGIKPRAKKPAADAKVVPIDRQARKPLGLKPAGGSGEPDAPAFISSVPSVASTLSAETLARAATMKDVAEALDAAIAIDGDGDAVLRSMIGGLRGQVSELKAALIEARHEIRELKLVQESLRISTRGESGRDGARGIPGRDGLRGEVGPQGPPGPRGEAAAKITAWTIDSDDFAATPVMSDGHDGATLYLRGMFESYNNAVSWIEDADLVEAARRSRAELEAEAAAFREGRPTRGNR